MTALIAVLLLLYPWVAQSSQPPPFRNKPDTLAPSLWLRDVLTSMAEGPIRADVRGIDPGQLLPLARLEYPRLVVKDHLSHPRLLDLSRVESFRHYHPWSGYYRLVVEEADRWVQVGVGAPATPEPRRAAAMKALAAAYQITGDRAYLDAIEEGFGGLAPLPKVVSLQGGNPGQGWGDDLEMGEALLQYAAAFDLTVGHIDPALAVKTASMFADVCDRLVDRMPLIAPDNHAIIISAGVGSMAIVLAGYEGVGRRAPQEWLDKALSFQSYALAAQVLPDGTYREGPHYARHIAAGLLPFFQYIYRIYHRNLAQHPRLTALFEWMVLTANPDGSVPQTDDGWSEDNLWEPLLIPLARSPEVVRWSYQRRSGIGLTYRPNMVDALAFASFWSQVQAPSVLPSRIYPDGGVAVFRDSWEVDAFQVLVTGEPNLSLGGRHEQIDPGNLLVQHGSQPLLVDAGYGPDGTGSTNRQGYLDAGSHNMVMLDGRGPEWNPLAGGDPGASIGGGFDGPVVGGCRVDMRYGPQKVQRRVLAPGHEYVLLEDLAPGNSASRVVSLFHAPKEVMPNRNGGFRWANGNASLTLVPLSPPAFPMRCKLSQSYHSHQPGQEQIHHRIELAWGEPEQASVLLIPEDGIRISPLAVTGSPAVAGWEVQGECSESYAEKYFGYWSRTGRFRDGIILGDGSLVQADGVGTDARRVWWREDGAGNLTALSFRQAHVVQYISFSVETSAEVTGTLWRDGFRWFGLVECGGDTVEWRFRGIPDPGMVRYGGRIVPYEYKSGVLIVALAGEGAVEFGSGPPAIWVPERRLEEGSFLEEVAWDPNPEQRYRFMSPRDRARMEGEVISNIRYNITGSLDPWAQDCLGVEGGGEALVGYALGMADAMTSTEQVVDVRIPHRTSWQRKVGDAEIALEGEGFWGGENLRRFGGTVGIHNRGWLEYREERPFQEITRRSVHIGTPEGYQGGISHQDGPVGDIWGGDIEARWRDTDHRASVQWGTGNLDDWRWGEWGIYESRWVANVVGGRTTGASSLLADVYRALNQGGVGCRYQYLSRGKHRGALRASQRWERVVTAGSWEWTGGSVPSVHIVRHQLSLYNASWHLFSHIMSIVPDSLEVSLSGSYTDKPMSIRGGLTGNSQSPTVVPDRMMAVSIDPVAWGTVEVEGRISGETERSLNSSVSVHPVSAMTFHAVSGWNRACSGPVRVGCGWWWNLTKTGLVGSNYWRQWYPVREDGIWVSLVSYVLPPVQPMGSMSVRWDGGGEVREIRVRVESRNVDVGPGILYMEEPGVDRRFEGYFRIGL